MTGHLARVSSASRRLSSSKPDISGRLRSRIIQSKCCDFNKSRAVWPWSASLNSTPRVKNLRKPSPSDGKPSPFSDKDVDGFKASVFSEGFGNHFHRFCKSFYR